MALGVLTVLAGVLAGGVAQPGPLRVEADGTTPLPRTWSFQHPWVLFGATDDPRRVPTPEEVGCRLEGDSLPRQPLDMTAYGARVLEGAPVSALLLVGDTAEGSALTCTGADEHAPLWLAPSSEAPPFAPTGLAVLGAALLVLGALLHPVTPELPSRLRDARRRPGA